MGLTTDMAHRLGPFYAKLPSGQSTLFPPEDGKGRRTASAQLIDLKASEQAVADLQAGRSDKRMCAGVRGSAASSLGLIGRVACTLRATCLLLRQIPQPGRGQGPLARRSVRIF